MCGVYNTSYCDAFAVRFLVEKSVQLDTLLNDGGLYTMMNRFMVGTATVTTTVLIQVGLLLLLAAMVLFTILFTPFPGIHDAFHELRHSLYIVACH